MRLEDKLIKVTRETLIAKYGLAFLKLSEENQNEVIFDEILKTIQKIRA